MYEETDRVQALLSHVFLYKMFIPKWESSFGTQLWFISTIIQFYLVFLLLVTIKKKIGNKKFMILSLILSVFWWFFVAIIGKSEIRTWNSFFMQYLWEFSLGMVLADEYKHRPDRFTNKNNIRKLILFTYIGMIIFAYTGIKGGTLKLFNDIFSVMAFGGVCLILYRLKWIKSIFIRVNTFSYEWYLTHILVFTCCFVAFDKEIQNIIADLWVEPNREHSCLQFCRYFALF